MHAISILLHISAPYFHVLIFPCPKDTCLKPMHGVSLTSGLCTILTAPCLSTVTTLFPGSFAKHVRCLDLLGLTCTDTAPATQAHSSCAQLTNVQYSVLLHRYVSVLCACIAYMAWLHIAYMAWLHIAYMAWLHTERTSIGRRPLRASLSAQSKLSS